MTTCIYDDIQVDADLGKNTNVPHITYTSLKLLIKLEDAYFLKLLLNMPLLHLAKPLLIQLQHYYDQSAEMNEGSAIINRHTFKTEKSLKSAFALLNKGRCLKLEEKNNFVGNQIKTCGTCLD